MIKKDKERGWRNVQRNYRINLGLYKDAKHYLFNKEWEKMVTNLLLEKDGGTL